MPQTGHACSFSTGTEFQCGGGHLDKGHMSAVIHQALPSSSAQLWDIVKPDFGVLE